MSVEFKEQKGRQWAVRSQISYPCMTNPRWPRLILGLEAISVQFLVLPNIMQMHPHVLNKKANTHDVSDVQFEIKIYLIDFLYFWKDSI